MRIWGLLLLLILFPGCTGNGEQAIKPPDKMIQVTSMPPAATPVSTYEPGKLEECVEQNDECFYKVALKQDNYEYCELMSSQGVEGYTKNNCILEIAKKKMDISKCAQVVCKSGSFSDMPN